VLRNVETMYSGIHQERLVFGHRLKVKIISIGVPIMDPQLSCSEDLLLGKHLLGISFGTCCLAFPTIFDDTYLMMPPDHHELKIYK